MLSHVKNILGKGEKVARPGTKRAVGGTVSWRGCDPAAPEQRLACRTQSDSAGAGGCFLCAPIWPIALARLFGPARPASAGRLTASCSSGWGFGRLARCFSCTPRVQSHFLKRRGDGLVKVIRLFRICVASAGLQTWPTVLLTVYQSCASRRGLVVGLTLEILGLRMYVCAHMNHA